MTEYKDNYEAVRREWRERAVHFSYEERYRALGLSGYRDSGRLPLVFYGVRYEIDRESGIITEQEHPERTPDFYTEMSIYHLFYYSREQPRLSGVWVPFREIPGAQVFNKAFFEQTVHPFARHFDGRLEALLESGRRQGFRRIEASEAGFEAQAFECLPIRFLFWDGDDEFSAQANVLFDSHITQFLHEETVVLLAADGLRRLMDEK